MQNPKFESLLLRHLYREEKVLARMYANGSWHQFTGKDIFSHLYLSTQYWQNILDTEKKSNNIIFVTSNSYHSFIASFASILCGFNVIWLPTHLSKIEIEAVYKRYKCIAIATDIKDYASQWNDIKCPIIGIDNVIWTDGEMCLEEKYQKLKHSVKSELGTFRFISYKEDNTFSIETVDMDIFLKVSKTFMEHLDVPRNISWHSFEMMAPSQPFVHISKFCCLLNKGVLGFPNYESDLETSLAVLQPTFLFAEHSELEHLANIFKTHSKQPSGQVQRAVKKGLSSVQKFLGTSKAMKLSENTFSAVKRMARVTSKFTASFHTKLLNGLESLEFIVHGNALALENDVNFFESYGIPVIETYGTTHGVGILSSNTFHRPYFNTIGAPLEHVYFKLGSSSTLSYKIALENYEDNGTWHETNDIIQMTPFGFMLTGKKYVY